MICGLLSWYDEDPDWLYTAVATAGQLCDHILALDGAYTLFPDGEARSPQEQVLALQRGAERAGAAITVKQPGSRWMGNQIEKRTALFDLGKRVTKERDWFFVFDADDVVTYVPGDAKYRLERAREDVAVYTLSGARYHRGLFRALRSLRVEDAHYHYVAERQDTTIHLRGNDEIHQLEPFFTLTDLKVRHRRTARSPERQEQIREYHRRLQLAKKEPHTPEQWAAIPISATDG